jgi:hypothetical protein
VTLSPLAWAIAELDEPTSPEQAKALPRGLRDLPESELLRRVSRALDRLRPEVQRVFRSAMAKLGRSVNRTRLFAALEVGDGRLGADAFAWEAFREELQRVEAPKLQAYSLGNAAGDRLVSIATRQRDLAAIQGADEAARLWAQRNAAKLVTVIEQETRAALGELVRAAVPGRAPLFLERGVLGALRASDYAGLGGLDRPRARSLARFADEVARDPKVTPAQARAAVLRRKGQLLAARAKVVAQTEMGETLAAGRRQAWRDREGTYFRGDEWEREWVALLRETKPITCERCAAFDGERAPADAGQFRSRRGEVSRGPLLHPVCWCGERLVRRVGAARAAA